MEDLGSWEDVGIISSEPIMSMYLIFVLSTVLMNEIEKLYINFFRRFVIAIDNDRLLYFLFASTWCLVLYRGCHIDKCSHYR